MDYRKDVLYYLEAFVLACEFYRPDGVSLGVQIQAPVGLNHSIFNGSIS